MNDFVIKLGQAAAHSYLEKIALTPNGPVMTRALAQIRGTASAYTPGVVDGATRLAKSQKHLVGVGENSILRTHQLSHPENPLNARINNHRAWRYGGSVPKDNTALIVGAKKRTEASNSLRSAIDTWQDAAKDY